MCPGGKSEGTKYATYMDSPIGRLYLAEESGRLTHLLFAKHEPPCEPTETPLLSEVKKQLGEYFRGERRVFDLPLAPFGSDFQMACWSALLTIPYGSTCSYADIAQLVGSPKAYRAVGNANHNNPISIIIPCHRVIGADGSLAGYGGGLETKAYLLNLEQKTIGGNKICQLRK